MYRKVKILQLKRLVRAAAGQLITAEVPLLPTRHQYLNHNAGEKPEADLDDPLDQDTMGHIGGKLHPGLQFANKLIIERYHRDSYIPGGLILLFVLQATIPTFSWPARPPSPAWPPPWTSSGTPWRSRLGWRRRCRGSPAEVEEHPR